MEILAVNTHTVYLKGITLVGTVQIINPHQILAVFFQVQNSHENILDVFPSQGILLKNQTVSLRFKLKNIRYNNPKNTLNNWDIYIKCSYNIPYNQQILKYHSSNNKIQPLRWQEIKDQEGITKITVHISSQHELIKSAIRESVILQSTFGRQKSQISSIHQKQELNEHSLEQKVSIKFYPTTNNKKIQKSSSKQISELKIQSREDIRDKPHDWDNQKYLLIRFDTSIDQNQSRRQQITNVVENQKEYHLKEQNLTKQFSYSEERNLQIIVFAVIAGFSLVLGSSLRSLLS